jgi:hypothetical protein
MIFRLNARAARRAGGKAHRVHRRFAVLKQENCGGSSPSSARPAGGCDILRRLVWKQSKKAKLTPQGMDFYNLFNEYR